MDAIVLVGGQGTRLRPLTLARHKSLVPVANRPAIEHLFQWLEDAGFERAVLAIGRFNEDLADAYRGGRPGRLRIELVEEHERLESGGAIRHAVQVAGVEGRFTVLNGDIYVDFDFQAMLAAHEADHAELSMGLYPVAEPSMYGVAVVDSDRRITGFVEKPPPGTAPGNLVNAGVWIFEPGLVAEIPPGPVRVEETLFPSLVARSRAILGHTFEGTWADIGTPARYLELNEALTRANNVVAPSAVISPGADVSGSTLGEHVRVGSGASIRGSVVWDDVVVGARALVEESILADGVKVGEGANLHGAVVGQGATIAPGATVRDVSIEPGAHVDA